MSEDNKIVISDKLDIGSKLYTEVWNLNETLVIGSKSVIMEVFNKYFGSYDLLSKDMVISTVQNIVDKGKDKLEDLDKVVRYNKAKLAEIMSLFKAFRELDIDK